MMKLVGWAQSVVTFQGCIRASGRGCLYLPHAPVLGMTLFLIFPFCRLVHIWSAPVEYITRRYQLVRNRH